ALADRGARMRKNRINRITDWIGTGPCLVSARYQPQPVCVRSKSCPEPDRTLRGRVENCSPAQDSALNAVTGYNDLVGGSRDLGGDVRLSRSLEGGTDDKHPGVNLSGRHWPSPRWKRTTATASLQLGRGGAPVP